jgi:hypothetical protein
VHAPVTQLRGNRKRAEDWARRGREHKPELEKVRAAANAVVERLKPIEAELIQVKAKTRADTLNFPVRLNGKLAALAGNIGGGDGAPTRAARQVFAELVGRVEVQTNELARAVAGEVEALNNAIREAGLPPVGA